MNKIVVVGSLNMDLVIQTEKIPKLGETLLGSGFMTTPGGKGANQAVAAAKLGGNVSMIGRVGSDIFGEDLLKNLITYNIKTEGVRKIDDMPTGIAMIVIKDGDNFIIVDSGANSSLDETIIEALEGDIKNCDILMTQLEIPMGAVIKAIDLARKNGVKVLLNPAPAVKLSDELLSKIDIITPNESESEIITGLTVNNVEDAKKAVSYLMEKGIPQVVITLGGKGVVYNNGNKIIHKPVPSVKVLDTTAAGDSFSGALAVAISQGKEIDEAIDFGNMVGTLTVSKKGAQTSLPALKDVENFIKNGGI